MHRGVMTAALLAALWPHGSARAGEPPEISAKSRAPATIDAVVVVTDGVDAVATMDALALRAPQRTIGPGGRARPDVPLFAVAEIRRKDARTVAIAVILSDFRGYYRDVAATPEDAPRVAASALANLLAGIEEDSVRPDAEDVPLPVGATAEPAPAPVPVAEPPTPRPSLPVARPRPELLAELHGGALFGLPPLSPTGWAAGGGGLGLGVRVPSGLFGAVDVRGGGRGAADVGIVRVRASLQLGLALRRSAFELVVSAGPDVEPLRVRREGRHEVLTYPDGTTRDTAVLLGGHVRLSPGFLHVLPSGIGLRLGPRLELGGAGLATGGVARLVTGEGAARREVLRAGGLEVWAGIELGLWLPLRRRAQ